MDTYEYIRRVSAFLEYQHTILLSIGSRIHSRILDEISLDRDVDVVAIIL